MGRVVARLGGAFEEVGDRADLGVGVAGTGMLSADLDATSGSGDGKPVPTTDVEASDSDQAEQPARRTPGRLLDAAVVAAYALGGCYVTARLWLDIAHRVTADNEQDHVFFQFVLLNAARALTGLDNPLFSTALNAPYGVNMMANTSMLGLSLPLAPITLTLGPTVSLGLALVIGFAGTATAWYFVLRRHVTANRLVAFIAAGFCGFAPGLVSHGNAHPNIVAQFMLPLIVSRVIRLRDTGRPVRDGIMLGLMVTYQLFINEELVLYTAVACLVMVVVYALSRPAQALRSARPFAAGMAVAAGVALALMAYPLWFQFLGPQHYAGPFWWSHMFDMDLASYVAYARESIGGDPAVASRLAANPTEENSFFGWPLCVFAVVTGLVWFRVMAARLAFMVALVFAVLSFGNQIKIDGVQTGVPGPWKLFSGLPLLESVIVTRLALVVTAAVGVLLAVAGERIAGLLASMDDRDSRRKALFIWYGTVAAMLIPVAPTPLPTTTPAPVPAFFADGTWRQYVGDGSVVPVPPQPLPPESMRWLIAAKLEFRLADGYFLGPKSEHDPTPDYGPPRRPTAELLRQVAASGSMPQITDVQRLQAAADLRHWQADVLVLGPHPHADALRKAVDVLIGQPGRETGGVWVWDVRTLR
ncbi:YfhO family protein [Allorhizocola rhizosphaerae]|uniref:YfhO family protein n=1 Tax=Allorhizocola rhizosphaerae TaxID=1872709 RepID=UPI0013C2EA6C|nr:YfhO family protein [Allorhizocola rhizosphaerae]